MAAITTTATSGSEAAVPGFGRRLYLGWLELAAHFGEIQTQLIVGFVYLFVIGPTAVIATVAGRDLLKKRGFGEAKSAWNDADSTSKPDLERAKHQF